ncbi:MAG: hypothetical protein J0I43_11060 [Microbacterium sp.]|uniref:hypothetical protein n=1 Tax=Microbacterium sp. TaxID=51671 RepID=UPI001AD1AD81|nr:hypothetical protein [Microbacterium sp.]MBN9177894.1 hypothetical protein [Microbacterium sp.]
MTFHVLALAPAAVGLCCLAADRRRTRALEVGAALLMMLAMWDAAVTAFVPAAFWTAALVVGGMALAAVRGRVRGLRLGGDDVSMAVHSAAGMVVMAAMMLAMVGGAAVTAASHHHSGTPALAVAAVAGAVAYIVASAALAVRSHGRLARAQYLAMASSVGIMSLSLVV